MLCLDCMRMTDVYGDLSRIVRKDFFSVKETRMILVCVDMYCNTIHITSESPLQVSLLPRYAIPNILCFSNQKHAH